MGLEMEEIYTKIEITSQKEDVI